MLLQRVLKVQRLLSCLERNQLESAFEKCPCYSTNIFDMWLVIYVFLLQINGLTKSCLL